MGVRATCGIGARICTAKLRHRYTVLRALSTNANRSIAAVRRYDQARAGNGGART